MKRVYISGPYTMPDPAVNVRNAILAADAITAAGHEVYLPHLTHLWHLISPHEYRFWLERDLAWLPFCDAVVRLPGASSGADREVDEARTLAIPVYFGIEDLLDALKE